MGSHRGDHLGARDRAPPLESVSGKTIALMDIGKMRGDEFIDRLEQLCAERGIKTTQVQETNEHAGGSREMIKDIAETCDAVIIALSTVGRARRVPLMT